MDDPTLTDAYLPPDLLQVLSAAPRFPAATHRVSAISATASLLSQARGVMPCMMRVAPLPVCVQAQVPSAALLSSQHSADPCSFDAFQVSQVGPAGSFEKSVSAPVSVSAAMSDATARVIGSVDSLTVGLSFSPDLFLVLSPCSCFCDGTASSFKRNKG